MGEWVSEWVMHGRERIVKREVRMGTQRIPTHLVVHALVLMEACLCPALLEVLWGQLPDLLLDSWQPQCRLHQELQTGKAEEW